MSEVTDKYHKMDADMTELHLRMKRLERSQRWYDSILRRIIILGVTYLVSLLLMLALQLQNFWLHALIPTIPVAIDLIVELILRRRMSS